MKSESHLPMYFLISQEIIDKIKNKELRPGEKIVSENEIIKNYEVSNTTARKVLQEIENQGFARRVKGKGTFVSENVKASRSATKVLSFTKNMLQLGFKPRTKLLQCSLQKGGITKMVNGRNYSINGQVCRIDRLRYADNMPVLREIRYISANFCPGIEKLNLEGSLYDIYENKYQLKIATIYQTLSAIIIEGEELKYFDKEDIVPGFRVDGVTFCGKELVLEIEESIYCGDFYKFNIEATP
ncbi:MAG: GntR family transcriptional regulator [Bacteroidales bacterium]